MLAYHFYKPLKDQLIPSGVSVAVAQCLLTHDVY